MYQKHPRLFALLLTLVFFVLIWFYTKEFPVLSNTIDVRALVLGSVLTGVALAALGLWLMRSRLAPINKHIPELLFVLLNAAIFSPLVGSWLNRGLGSTGYQTFQFVSEKAFVASGYGFLRGEMVKVSGYHLTVTEQGRVHKFKYKKQAYYPLTRQGEEISLPVIHGLFGSRVILLK